MGSRVWPIVFSLAGLAAVSAQPQATVSALVAASRNYLIEYRKQVSFLLADETSVQRVLDEHDRETARRVMHGEFFVTYIPTNGYWMSVHDVTEVDGRPVDGHEDLRTLLERESLPGLGRRLVQRNAAFNIGHITRNFNEPTLALLALDPQRQSQFRFDRRGGPDARAGLVTITFRETGHPTLVRGVDGSDLTSRGEIAIDAATGRIERTMIQFVYGDVTAALTTTYEREPKLDVWVPAAFHERYQRRRNPKELIFCEATYTNYRRFEATVRIR